MEKLTNQALVRFCQHMLGAPYWFGASCQRATKNLFRINISRFPVKYNGKVELCERHIEENEIVTDNTGLLKGFFWTEGGEEILRALEDSTVKPQYQLEHLCPDKSPNGLFTWASARTKNWGEINTLPEIPGCIITMNNRLAIYEGNGYVIEANEKLGLVIRKPIENEEWLYWYQFPTLTYEEENKNLIDKAIATSKEPPKIKGSGYAISNVLFREAPSEDSKFLKIIYEKEKVETYNDSDTKWLHINYKGQEGYALTDLFIYFPQAPSIETKDFPKEFNKEIMGNYYTLNNVGLRNRAHAQGISMINLPKDYQVYFTGGHTDKWYQVYTIYKDKAYLGYIERKFLKKMRKDDAE